MEHSYISALLLAAAGAVLAQNKSSTPAACNAGFYPGTHTVLDTVPYPYPQMPSIIDNFRDITWNSIPSDAVSLDGTDSTIGTQARRQPVRRDRRCQALQSGQHHHLQ
ncbi:hypothetical protein LPUS_00479 [Lasallia pustulata]|uniref:Uncharacterized protein n=1 Tax=Lasallia pustulata TaxID=136370 RepID=A0A1W5CRR9_9LECA|nr:hypothetical protein LPUS_00479 [Lasallia pustulata]